MYWLFGTFLLWLIPVLAVGARGLHLSPALAILVAIPIAAGIALPAARFVARAIQTSDRLPRIYYAAFLIAAITAIIRIASVSVFIADVRQIEFSVQPEDAFRRIHSCVSAYAESARLLAGGEPDIYHRDHYRPGGNDRVIGPLRVDPFHYPPPFLLLPQAIRTVAPGFWDFRRVWFTLQALVLGGVVVAIAGWIGGRHGALALLGGTMMLAMPHAAATFQQGNFQITAVPLAAVSFVLLLAGRSAAGGGLLAYAALAKIFPGILVIPLLAGRRWRPVAWVAGMGAVLLTLSLATQGRATFEAFIHTSLPEISSGSAFPQTESPAHSRVNWSAYGQTVRARQLGASWLTQRRGLLAAELYGVLIALFAAWAGWRARFSLSTPDGRLVVAQFAIALVSLASFRSPFVGAIYGVVATLWLMGLLSALSTRYTAHWMAGMLALGILTALMPSPSQPPSTAWVVISGVLVFVCVGINAWGVWLATRLPAERDRGNLQEAVRHGNAHPSLTV